MKNIYAYNIVEFIEEMLESLGQIEGEAIDLATVLTDEDDKIEALTRIQDYIQKIYERVR